MALCSLLSTLFTSSLQSEIPLKRWVVYYGPNVCPENFCDYDLIVLEPDNHPHINLLLEQKKTVLGYLSLGEVSPDRSFFKEIDQQGLLYQANPTWPDSRYVDMRSEKWIAKVIQEIIPSILFQRFSGIFIDTLDAADSMEKNDPIAFKGSQEAAIRLIRTIRLHYPQIKIMVNRGFSILPHIAEAIDMVLAESIYINSNEKVYQEISDQLHSLKQSNPDLELYSLDYWDPSDPKGIKALYDKQRKEGFIPYVTTPELNQIIPEPD